MATGAWDMVSVRNGGGGGKGGLPPITVQDAGICAFQGDPGWVPKIPPPPPISKCLLYKLFLRLLNITRNITCYNNKWVTIKTVLVA